MDAQYWQQGFNYVSIATSFLVILGSGILYFGKVQKRPYHRKPKEKQV
ncbi:MAG TPA: hypothetical protein VLF93_03725 [Candidatus Saccharimonadales bacterium]|nr:hypothetical protein [Candidatus Saccharimonadales bacterium]